jgi:hypothetical protein
MIEIRDGAGRLMYEGITPNDFELIKFRERFKHAFSYQIPMWRFLFFNKVSNHIYWLKQVNKRLCA